MLRIIVARRKSLAGAAVVLTALVVLAVTLVLGLQCSPRPVVDARGLDAIRVPPEFEVEVAVSSDLVAYPMLGTLDDRGRLFFAESSGNTMKTPEMAANPDYIVRLVEDTDGDGFYDRSNIFADKLTSPNGAVWYGGSLYVATPPDLLRFEDTDDDGVADVKETVLSGWNLSANAASMHGPFLGPDGWLYITDGRHGFKIRTKEGKLLEGKAARIWRCRPDGSGLEWLSGGGMDNPLHRGGGNLRDDDLFSESSQRPARRNPALRRGGRLPETSRGGRGVHTHGGLDAGNDQVCAHRTRRADALSGSRLRR